MKKLVTATLGMFLGVILSASVQASQSTENIKALESENDNGALVKGSVGYQALMEYKVRKYIEDTENCKRDVSTIKTIHQHELALLNAVLVEQKPLAFE